MSALAAGYSAMVTIPELKSIQFYPYFHIPHIACQGGSVLNGNQCETCAVDTYKASGSTSCASCPSGTTTAGQTGQTSCGENIFCRRS